MRYFEIVADRCNQIKLKEHNDTMLCQLLNKSVLELTSFSAEYEITLKDNARDRRARSSEAMEPSSLVEILSNSLTDKKIKLNDQAFVQENKISLIRFLTLFLDLWEVTKLLAAAFSSDSDEDLDEEEFEGHDEGEEFEVDYEGEEFEEGYVQKDELLLDQALASFSYLQKNKNRILNEINEFTLPILTEIKLPVVKDYFDAAVLLGLMYACLTETQITSSSQTAHALEAPEGFFNLVENTLREGEEEEERDFSFEPESTVAQKWEQLLTFKCDKYSLLQNVLQPALRDALLSYIMSNYDVFSAEIDIAVDSELGIAALNKKGACDVASMLHDDLHGISLYRSQDFNDFVKRMIERQYNVEFCDFSSQSLTISSSSNKPKLFITDSNRLAVSDAHHFPESCDKLMEFCRAVKADCKTHEEYLMSEMAKNDNLKRTGTFSFSCSSSSSVSFYGSMTNRVAREGIGYIRHEVAGDGDCGYTSFGITREDAVQLLSINVHNISNFIKIPVKHALLIKGFYDYLLDQNIVGVSYANALENEQLLERYSTDLAIQSAYIEYDVEYRQIDAGYSHPAVLQALAHIQDIEIHMWRLGEDDVLIPHNTHEGNYAVYTPQEAVRRVDLLFVNGNHFERLELSSYGSSITENCIYPIKTSLGRLP